MSTIYLIFTTRKCALDTNSSVHKNPRTEAIFFHDIPDLLLPMSWNTRPESAVA
jgi:hypothetical protein